MKSERKVKFEKALLFAVLFDVQPEGGYIRTKFSYNKGEISQDDNSNFR